MTPLSYGGHNLRVRQIVLLFFAAYALLIFFYSKSAGLSSSNEGSHFALTKAILERTSSKISPEADFASVDSSFKDGEIYSDRSPGQGLLMGFTLKLFDPWWTERLSFFSDTYFGEAAKAQAKRIAFVMQLPALSMALIFIFLWLSMGLLNIDLHTRIAISVGGLLGSLFLRYGSFYYSHSFAAALASATLYLTIRWSNSRRGLDLFLATFIFGFGVCVEYALVALAPALLIFVLKTPDGSPKWRPLVKSILPGFLFGIAPLLIYNYLSFGNPLRVAHYYHRYFDYHHSLKTTFDLGLLLKSLPALLWGAEDLFGLFPNSPWLWVVPFAMLSYSGTRNRPPLLLGLWGAFSALLFVGSFKGYVGGWDMDYRQILYALPFLLIAGAILISDSKPSREIWIRLLLWGLIGLSIYYEFPHLRHLNNAKFHTTWINLAPAVFNTLPATILLAFIFVLLFSGVKVPAVQSLENAAPPPKMPNPTTPRIVATSLVLIAVLIGLGLRLYGLRGFEGGTFISDENFSGFERVFDTLEGGVQHGRSYSVVSHIMDWHYDLFGLEVYRARVFAVLLSFAGLVFLSLAIGRFLGTRLALGFGLFAGSCVYLVYFSRFAFEHAFAFFFVSLALLAFVNSWNSKTRAVWWGLFFVTFPLSCFVYPGVRLFWMALSASWVVQGFLDRKPDYNLRTLISPPALLGGVGFLIYSGYFYMTHGRDSLSYYGGGLLAPNLYFYFESMWAILKDLFHATHSWIIGFGRPFIDPSFLFLFVFGIVLIVRDPKWSRLRFVLITLFILFCFSALAYDQPGARRMIMGLFCIGLVAAVGMDYHRQTYKPGRTWIFLGLGLILLDPIMYSTTVLSRKTSYNFGNGLEYSIPSSSELIHCSIGGECLLGISDPNSRDMRHVKSYFGFLKRYGKVPPEVPFPNVANAPPPPPPPPKEGNESK